MRAKEPPQPITRRTMTLLAALALILVGAAAYRNSLHGVFVFDDRSAIEENTAVRRLWPFGPILRGPRPVVDLTFAANYAAGRRHVEGYHLVNLAVHVLAALALFGIVRRTLMLPVLASRFDEASAAVLGFCAALLWMVHPLQTEAVTYLIQRVESLMGLFYLLTLYCFIRSVCASPRLRVSASWLVAAVAACALGMGCKEVMVTAPVVVLLYDRCFIAGSFKEAFQRRWGFYLALAATWLILARSVAVAFGSQTMSAGFQLQEVRPFQYAWSEPGVILHYLALTFWPAGLCIDYDWPVADGFLQIAPGVIVIGGLLAATIWALLSRPFGSAQGRAQWGFIGAWFFLVLAPSSSILPIKDLAFEHRMYLPLAAPAVAVVIAIWLEAKRLSRPAERALVITALLVLCAGAALCAATIRRNAQYSSSILIWEDATAKRPQNVRAWTNLGEAYVSAARCEPAIVACDRALKLDPSFPPAYGIRGRANANLGRMTEAISDYNKAIALKSDFAGFYSDLGLALAQIGRLPEAIQNYGRAIRLKPGFAVAYNGRGAAYADAGRISDALEDYDAALRLDPDYASAYNNRGNALADAQRDAEAIRDYDRAIALQPDFPEAYNNRGGVYAQSGRMAEALQDFDAAIALKPDYAGAWYNRAMLHFQRKEYALALEDVKMCEKLGGRPNSGFIKMLEQRNGVTP